MNTLDPGKHRWKNPGTKSDMKTPTFPSFFALVSEIVMENPGKYLKLQKNSTITTT